MITHVLVELKHPVKDEYFHMDTVFPNEYYGYGTPLVRCKDCVKYKIYNDGYCPWIEQEVEEDFFCADGKRK